MHSSLVQFHPVELLLAPSVAISSSLTHFLLDNSVSSGFLVLFLFSAAVLLLVSLHLLLLSRNIKGMLPIFANLQLLLDSAFLLFQFVQL